MARSAIVVAPGKERTPVALQVFRNNVSRSDLRGV